MTIHDNEELRTEERIVPEDSLLLDVDDSEGDLLNIASLEVADTLVLDTSVEDTQTEHDKNGRWLKRVGGGIGVIVVAATSIFVGSQLAGGDENSPTDTVPVEAETPDVTNAAEENASPEVTNPEIAEAEPVQAQEVIEEGNADEDVDSVAEPATPPEAQVETIENPNFGVIDVVSRFHQDDEGTITVVRENGQPVVTTEELSIVSYDQESVNKLMLDTLSQLSALLSISDAEQEQQMLDIMTPDPIIQDKLRVFKDIVIDEQSEILRIPTSPNFHVAIYDNANNPAEFHIDDKAYLSASIRPADGGGPVYLQLTDDAEYQGLTVTSPWYSYEVENLTFVYRDDTQRSGKVVLSDIGYDLQLMPEIDWRTWDGSDILHGE